MSHGIKRLLAVIVLGFVASYCSFAQAWVSSSEDSLLFLSDKWQAISPEDRHLYRVNAAELFKILSLAPHETETSVRPGGQRLVVPLPNGSLDTFLVVHYDMMEPALAARYPDIHTLWGLSATCAYRAIRCDWTPQGFHAVIYGLGQKTIYVEPLSDSAELHYVAYYTEDADEGLQIHGMPCLTLEAPRRHVAMVARTKAPDCKFRQYRLAVAATGEYSNFHGATGPAQSGLVLGAITTAVNYINAIFEQDLGVRMQLVANTDAVFYYNPSTDPYTGSNIVTMLPENQAVIDTHIGADHYDVGHVFHRSGQGGVAYIGVVCWWYTCSEWYCKLKAQGVSSTNSPNNISFYKLAAHEFGHMFNARHSFNGDAGPCMSNRSASAAYEPGSGSTLMSYAGVCSPQNVQGSTDPYFHTYNITEVFDGFLTTTYNNCETVLSTNNTAPVVDPLPSYTIPHSTPFVLTATATDSDGHSLSYTWEQLDLGPAGAPAPSNIQGPMFRSYPPSTSPVRYFPPLSNVINNTSSSWEVLPNVARTLTFNVTVRDWTGTYGCVKQATTVINTTNSGPFQVTHPNTSTVSWQGGQTYTVTWNVVGSNVYCPLVDILLSQDGGYTYPITLASGTPNDGVQSVTIPTITSPVTTARVMVRGHNHIFYDISDVNFTLLAGILPVEWLYFEIKSHKDGQAALLEWATATEQDNAGFFIERSTATELIFENIAWVQGKGNSSSTNYYSYTDRQLQAGRTYYYRLKQIDYDGTISYSPIKSFRVDEGKDASLRVYYLSSSREVIVEGAMLDFDNGVLEVFDIQGRKLQALYKNKGEHMLRIFTQSWPPGTYMLRMRAGGEVATTRIVLF